MEPDLAFPVVGFWLSQETYGYRHNERFQSFASWEELREAREGELRRSARLGMLLVDNRGRSWMVAKVWSVGRRTPLWARAILTLFRDRAAIIHHVDYQFEERGPISFDEVQNRVCQSIRRNPDDWADDEALAGEDGPPLKLGDVLDAAEEAVRRATNLAELFAGLEAAWPY